VKSCVVRLGRLHIVAVIFKRRRLHVRPLAVACVESSNLRVGLDIFIVISCPCLLHASHIVHSIFHWNNSYWIDVLKVLGLRPKSKSGVWAREHEVRKGVLVFLKGSISLVDDKSGLVNRPLTGIVQYCQVSRIHFLVIRLLRFYNLLGHRCHFDLMRFSFGSINTSFEVVNFKRVFKIIGLAVFLAQVSFHFLLNQIVVKSELLSWVKRLKFFSW
jgi:hypothetical protein